MSEMREFEAYRRLMPQEETLNRRVLGFRMKIIEYELTMKTGIAALLILSSPNVYPCIHLGFIFYIYMRFAIVRYSDTYNRTERSYISFIISYNIIFLYKSFFFFLSSFSNPPCVTQLR